MGYQTAPKKSKGQVTSRSV